MNTNCNNTRRLPPRPRRDRLAEAARAAGCACGGPCRREAGCAVPLLRSRPGRGAGALTARSSSSPREAHALHPGQSSPTFRLASWPRSSRYCYDINRRLTSRTSRRAHPRPRRERAATLGRCGGRTVQTMAADHQARHRLRRYCAPRGECLGRRFPPWRRFAGRDQGPATADGHLPELRRPARPCSQQDFAIAPSADGEALSEWEARLHSSSVRHRSSRQGRPFRLPAEVRPGTGRAGHQRGRARPRRSAPRAVGVTAPAGLDHLSAPRPRRAEVQIYGSLAPTANSQPFRARHSTRSSGVDVSRRARRVRRGVVLAERSAPGSGRRSHAAVANADVSRAVAARQPPLHGHVGDNGGCGVVQPVGRAHSSRSLRSPSSRAP